ncbi:MAG: hypothetical protein M1503_09575 [Thaumarchaeota archaeon]|nr:hypothetical protein [Nitrososphaerota archaeon]MCL5318488.1 hypothetical protein [Nitrososphaerota archaeon]
MIPIPASVRQGYRITKRAIGSIISRKNQAGGKTYRRIWIYVPAKISEDTAFPFKPGDPCQIEIDLEKRQLTVTQISEDEAQKQGWAKRPRSHSPE